MCVCCLRLGSGLLPPITVAQPQLPLRVSPARLGQSRRRPAACARRTCTHTHTCAPCFQLADQEFKTKPHKGGNDMAEWGDTCAFDGVNYGDILKISVRNQKTMSRSIIGENVLMIDRFFDGKEAEEVVPVYGDADHLVSALWAAIPPRPQGRCTPPRLRPRARTEQDRGSAPALHHAPGGGGCRRCG